MTNKFEYSFLFSLFSKIFLSSTVCMSVLCISRERRLNKYYLWEESLVFYMKIFTLISQSVHLIRKIAVQSVCSVFAFFLANTKIIFGCNFKTSLKSSFCIWLTNSHILSFFRHSQKCFHHLIWMLPYLHQEARPKFLE